MIHFEITQSPDDNARTHFQFHFNQIYLGRTDGHLHIQDSALAPNHLMLEVIENDLLVHPQPTVESYLLNGKRATSVRKIKIGDQITLGQTTLKVLSFTLTPTLTKKEILNQKLQTLVEGASSRLAVIESLSQKSKG